MTSCLNSNHAIKQLHDAVIVIGIKALIPLTHPLDLTELYLVLWLLFFTDLDTTFFEKP